MKSFETFCSDISTKRLLTLTHTITLSNASPIEAYRKLSDFEPFALSTQFGKFKNPLIALLPHKRVYSTLNEANQALQVLQGEGQKGLLIGLAHFEAFHHQEPTKLPKAIDPITLFAPEVFITFEADQAHITYQTTDTTNPTHHYEKGLALLTQIENALQQSTVQPKTSPLSNLIFKPSSSVDAYTQMLKKAKAYIEAGDIFQVVLSNTFKAEVHLDPLQLFDELVKANPSEYAMLLKDKDKHLLVTSPEMMVSQSKEELVTVPIAGTRGVKQDGRDDDRSKELLADPKERSEHLMLVDLARNDLSKAAQPGTVYVADYCFVKHLPRVMHLVSIIKAKTLENAGPLEGLIHTFPAGTVSGAPKIRAAQIIQELEPHRRDYYGGTVFLNGYDHTLESCITIRSIVHTPDSISLQLGSGIVYDSNGVDERKELYNKGKALFEAIENTIEGRVHLDFNH